MSRIVIVDDDVEIGRELSAALTTAGHSTSAICGLDAASAATLDTDIVILDLNMPGLDGFGSLELISSLPRRPAVVLASAQSPRIIAAAAETARATGLTVLGTLVKPFRLRELFALCASLPPADSIPAPSALPVSEQELVDGLDIAVQSKRRLDDGVVVGFEALARFPPHLPISVEEAFGPSVSLKTQIALTIRTIEKALDWSRGAETIGDPLPVAVNCTPQVICHPTFIGALRAAVGASGLAPSALEIELTEHPSLDQSHEIVSRTSQLSMLGFPIVMDDFGKGMTSFDRLAKLPIRGIKIDKEVFWGAYDGALPCSLLLEVIRYCARLEIQTTVEGIESEEHRRLARDLGAHYGQGYLWDRPRRRDQWRAADANLLRN